MVEEDATTPSAAKLFGLLCENEKLAMDLIGANKALVYDNEKLTIDLVAANRKLVFENKGLTTELIAVNRTLESQQEQHQKWGAALLRSDRKLLFQQGEKDERAAELVIANEELLFQQGEKQDRAAELLIANEELLVQQGEKTRQTAELVRVNKELALEAESGKRADELMIANSKLALQNSELEKRAEELVSSNKARLELLAQLLQSQKLESLGTLAGGIAHDMNNVLGAILGLASAHLEIQPPGSAAYRAFETISKAAVRGGRMAKSLLNFARQSPAEEHVLDLNVILREEVRLLEHTTLSKVHLQLELASDLRPMSGDASALTHAFMNLCVNAVDAMPENGTLTLRTRNVEDDWVEVEVIDTGIGMTRDVMEKAMNPFFTTKPEGMGTGLGLSLVYSTVKAHGGLMELHSEPGQGTRVDMRFPACKPISATTDPQAALRSALPSVGLHVLLVDDDELIQSSTRTILELLGHTVTWSLSGEEAMEKLESGLRPDVVILDINMPGLGGARTLTCIRGLDRDLPVLLSTGRVDQTAVNLVAAHAHVRLLPKPFSLKELQAHLQPDQS